MSVSLQTTSSQSSRSQPSPHSVSDLQLPDDIAKASIALYDCLPSHGKPVTRNNGVREWTILATICLVRSSSPEEFEAELEDEDNADRHLKSSSKQGQSMKQSKRIIPVSLGTGVKCLPYSKLSVHGDTVHDCHAEIIARRGFVRWLLNQAQLLQRQRQSQLARRDDAANAGNEEVREEKQEKEKDSEGIFVEWKEDGSFGLKEGTETWMYVSMLPCGDASTVYTAAHQPASEASQWVEADNAAASVPGLACASIPSSSPPSTSRSTSTPAAIPTSIRCPSHLEQKPPSPAINISINASGTCAQLDSEASAAATASTSSMSGQYDQTPRLATTTTTTTDVGVAVARGRSGYTSLSTLRTKPGRPDSIPSISMSCSDKLALCSILGLQGALLSSLYRDPIYLDGIVVGGVEVPDKLNNSVEGEARREEAEAWTARIKGEVERALWGRLESIQDYVPPPYRLHRPAVHFTSIPFAHSKSSVSTLSFEAMTDMYTDHQPPTEPSRMILAPVAEPAPSPLSLSYLPSVPSPIPKRSANSHTSAKPKPRPSTVKAEILTDGGLLGYPWKKGRLLREKGRSRICKLEIYRAYREVMSVIEAEAEAEPMVEDSSNATKGHLTYHQAKHPLPLPPRLPPLKKTQARTRNHSDATSDPTSHESASTSFSQQIVHLYQGQEAVLRYQRAKRVLRGIPSVSGAGAEPPLRGLEQFAEDGLLATTAMEGEGPTDAIDVRYDANNDHPDGNGKDNDDEARDNDRDGDGDGFRDRGRSKGRQLKTPPLPPFKGWLVSGEKFESFDSEGTVHTTHTI
ncbi:hypothetical protein I316_04220 [Kwoniella heveanensis BCC8398]|uniref:tRNA-specific adenosine deaminase 1 n=1 Tax=Kwoniella heveanensis BCC8398 TaxID=1296120 RepID=A0A1B9GTE8_9TREE|nr:hypothetical protein I316_04220 [Kwoniella heveanensis BCC8398]